MKSGLTPPTRPWFALTTADEDLAKFKPVKEWLDKVSKLIFKVLASGNAYNAVDSMYEELLTFGTAASIMQDDFEDVIYPPWRWFLLLAPPSLIPSTVNNLGAHCALDAGDDGGYHFG